LHGNEGLRHCNCSRCKRARTARLGLAIGVPALAIIALVVFLPSLSMTPEIINETTRSVSDNIASTQGSIEDSIRPLDNERIAQLIHEKVNEERRKAALTALQYDEALARVATKHSEDMASKHYFDHVSPDGKDPSDRAAEGDYRCFKSYPDGSYSIGIAENLVQGGRYYGDYTEEQIAANSVDSWMNSGGHRANILNADYDKEGIGIAPDSRNSGTLYITQNFC
jgi:uncharacterized protein YkwD